MYAMHMETNILIIILFWIYRPNQMIEVIIKTRYAMVYVAILSKTLNWN